MPVPFDSTTVALGENTSISTVGLGVARTPRASTAAWRTGRARSNTGRNRRGIVRIRPRNAYILEATSRIIVAVGGSPGRRLVPHGMLLPPDVGLIVLLLEVVDRFFVAGRGYAAAHRQEQTNDDGRDGRDVDSHDTGSVCSLSSRRDCRRRRAARLVKTLRIVVSTVGKARKVVRRRRYRTAIVVVVVVVVR